MSDPNQIGKINIGPAHYDTDFPPQPPTEDELLKRWNNAQAAPVISRPGVGSLEFFATGAPFPKGAIVTKGTGGEGLQIDRESMRTLIHTFAAHLQTLANSRWEPSPLLASVGLNPQTQAYLLAANQAAFDYLGQPGQRPWSADYNREAYALRRNKTVPLSAFEKVGNESSSEAVCTEIGVACYQLLALAAPNCKVALVSGVASLNTAWSPDDNDYVGVGYPGHHVFLLLDDLPNAPREEGSEADNRAKAFIYDPSNPVQPAAAHPSLYLAPLSGTERAAFFANKNVFTEKAGDHRIYALT